MAYGKRADPPPDPLWFPDSGWPRGRNDEGCSESGLAPWVEGSARVEGAPRLEDSARVEGAPSETGADEGSVFSANQLRGSNSIPRSASGFPNGLSGCLRLSSAGSLNQEQTGSALQGLRLLEGWAAAARVRLIHRQHLLMIEELQSFNAERAAEDAASGKAAAPRAVDHSLAFSLTATEIATMLGIPEGTAKALVDEACELCERCPGTLDSLERAAITPAQALTILEDRKSVV